MLFIFETTPVVERCLDGFNSLGEVCCTIFHIDVIAVLVQPAMLENLNDILIISGCTQFSDSPSLIFNVFGGTLNPKCSDQFSCNSQTVSRSR